MTVGVGVSSGKEEEVDWVGDLRFGRSGLSEGGR